MRYDLRYAGLDSTLEQRLRIAANALAAHRLQARASRWDGTRCDIVAANPSDAYGRRVLEIARRRGTPALELGPTELKGEPSVTVARLTQILHEMLRNADGNLQPDDPSEHATTSSTCGLVQLAGNAQLAGRNVEARYRSTRIWLLPESGRVLSASLSDQLRAREQLAVSSAWSFTTLTADSLRGEPPGEISTSLDSFLLLAAWQPVRNCRPSPRAR